MGKIIKIKSRQSVNTLRQLLPLNEAKESYSYVVEPDWGKKVTTGYTDDGKQWLDLPGGPRIMVGESVHNHIIKNIDYSYDLDRYIITFEA